MSALRIKKSGRLTQPRHLQSSFILGAVRVPVPSFPPLVGVAEHTPGLRPLVAVSPGPPSMTASSYEGARDLKAKTKKKIDKRREIKLTDRELGGEGMRDGTSKSRKIAIDKRIALE